MIEIAIERIQATSLAGRGGKDQLILQFFPELIAESRPLWDARHRTTGQCFEFKKQANLQWFDIGKYHDLSAEERAVWMTFLLHRNGAIDTIFMVPLGVMLDLLTSPPSSPETAGHSRPSTKQS